MSGDGSLVHTIAVIRFENLPLKFHGENAPALPDIITGKDGRLLHRPQQDHPAANIVLVD